MLQQQWHYPVLHCSLGEIIHLRLLAQQEQQPVDSLMGAARKQELAVDSMPPLLPAGHSSNVYLMFQRVHEPILLLNTLVGPLLHEQLRLDKRVAEQHLATIQHTTRCGSVCGQR